MIVVDSSALLEYLVESPRGVRVAEVIRAHGDDLRAPAAVDLETLSALRSLLARGEVTEVHAARVVAELATMEIIRYPHEPLLPRVWQLRGNITPYDAAYIALAEELEAPFVTCDRRLASAPAKHRVRITLIT